MRQLRFVFATFGTGTVMRCNQIMRVPFLSFILIPILSVIHLVETVVVSLRFLLSFLSAPFISSVPTTDSYPPDVSRETSGYVIFVSFSFSMEVSGKV